MKDPRDDGDEASIEEELSSSPYLPIREMAKGGMGQVYEVEHRELGLRRVMKLLHQTLADLQGAAARLKVEGRVLTRLKSVHLVEVVDFGYTPAGRPYLVTELLLGESLRDFTRRRGSLPAGKAVEILLQVLAGLEVVHRARLVHRDIKLDNIFYCDADESGKRVAKILDFGIAKIAAEDREAMGGLAPTAENMLLGTPRFMAPEQIMSSPVDARTDLYSTGLVLYQMLAGKSPFDTAATQLDLLRAQLYDVPAPVSSCAPRPLPETLDAVLAKSLAKAPNDRFADAPSMAAALRQAMRAWAEGPASSARSSEAGGATEEAADTLVDRTDLSALAPPAPEPTADGTVFQPSGLRDGEKSHEP